MQDLTLNQKNLSVISKKLSVPSYSKEELKTGLVHIGVGGFHRSHQAYYLHQLLEKYDVTEWGICGVGMREQDRMMNDVLTKQNGLYTLITQHPNGEVDCEVIGAIKEFILAVDTPDLLIAKLADADTKIVSLTITEGGYNIHPVSGEFNFENEAVQHDLQHPEKPKTVFGFLTAALKIRKEAGRQAFTIMSCDNIQHNGAVAREMFLSFAQRQDTDLASWMEANVCFPNTMVDRITPVTTAENINYLETTYGVKDEWPVTCEPFIQWVVEDKFSNGRPSLEKLGVQFVKDVTPYEKMKIRLLNAGHSVLGITGAIHGHPTINACMGDSVFASFMRRFMDMEVTPVLDSIEGIDIESYKDTLEERFANPNIKDSVSRICAESSAKLPKFLIPTISENIESGGSIEFGTFVLAAWCFYSDKQVDEKGEDLVIIDVKKDELHQTAANTNNNSLSFLSLNEFPSELVNNKRFTKAYEEAIKAIYEEKGIAKLMQKMIA